MKIYFSNDEYENAMAQPKGYRLDVVVEADKKIYRLSVYDTVRLLQDFESEYAQSGYYAVEGNLVLVRSVTQTEIITTLHALYKNGYFRQLLAQNHLDLSGLHCVFSSP